MKFENGPTLFLRRRNDCIWRSSSISGHVFQRVALAYTEVSSCMNVPPFIMTAAPLSAAHYTVVWKINAIDDTVIPTYVLVHQLLNSSVIQNMWKATTKFTRLHLWRINHQIASSCPSNYAPNRVSLGRSAYKRFRALNSNVNGYHPEKQGLLVQLFFWSSKVRRVYPTHRLHRRHRENRVCLLL